MNVQTNLIDGGTWESPTIDFYSNDYCNYKTMNLFCSADVSGCELNVMTAQDVSEPFKIVLLKDFGNNYNTSYKIVHRFMKLRVNNMAAMAQNIIVHCKFELEDKLMVLADAYGTPISSENPLQVLNSSSPNMNIYDSNGNGIRSNAMSGALYAQISDSYGQTITSNNNGSINCNITDSVALTTSISGVTATAGSMNVNVTNSSSNHNILYSIVGNPIQTNMDKLIVDVDAMPNLDCYIRNTPSVNVLDSYGAVIDGTNPLHVTNDKHLSTSTDSVVAILGDGNGQYINASNNNLNVALFDSDGNNLVVSEGGLNVHMVNSRIDTNFYASDGSPITSNYGKLSVQQVNLSAESDVVQANLYSSNGVELHQTMNALNVYDTRNLSTSTDSVIAILGDTDGHYVDVSNNKLCVWVTNQTQQTNSILDSSGNSVLSTDNALNVFNTRNLNTSTDSVVCLLGDASGNFLDVVDNKLVVIVDNQQSNSILDSSGNSLFSTENALNTFIINPQLYVNLCDISSNGIASTNSSLNVHQTGTVTSMLTDGTYSVGTTAGALHVSDIMFDVASGQYNGGFGLTMNATKIIGYRAVVDASGEDIGTITAKTFPYSVLNDSTLYVYSTSTQDYSGGTGAGQILIKGIDSTGGSSTSIISANGTYHANA